MERWYIKKSKDGWYLVTDNKKQKIELDWFLIKVTVDES